MVAFTDQRAGALPAGAGPPTGVRGAAPDGGVIGLRAAVGLHRTGCRPRSSGCSDFSQEK